MSVTIRISDNAKFCRENGLVEQEIYDCQFCQDGNVDPNCPDCLGKGKVVFDHFPFEATLANGNFSSVWQALGLPFDWCGSIDGRIVQRAIANVNVDAIVRPTKVEGIVTSCGVDAQQARAYLDRLAEIANEAARREENVVWC